MNEYDICFIVGLVIGFVFGVACMLLYLVNRSKSIIAKIEGEVGDAVEDHFLGVNVEKHDDVYRFYNEKNGQFILQTTTLDGLSKEFSRMYPTKTCYLAGGDETLIEELKEQLGKK